MKPVLIFGAGQVAQVFAEYLSDNGYTPVAFVVDAGHMPQIPHGPTKWDPLGTCRTLAFDKVREEVHKHEAKFVVGMSFKGLNKPRAEKFEAMCAKGYEPLGFCDRHARGSPYSANARLGTFIMNGNTVQTGVEIGENCVLWSNNHVGHHSFIGSHVWLSSGITVSGACEIGDYSFIGSGVTIADNVKIGKRCIIGAGSLVLKDVPDDSVVAAQGTPISKVSSDRAARLLG